MDAKSLCFCIIFSKKKKKKSPCAGASALKNIVVLFVFMVLKAYIILRCPELLK